MKKLSEVLHYYLPYKVEMNFLKRYNFGGQILDTDHLPLRAIVIDGWISLEGALCYHPLKNFKPILHPLSSLDAKYFKDNGIDLDDEIEISELENGYRTINSMHFSTVQLCSKNHIDIFGLIESGQAIKK